MFIKRLCSSAIGFGLLLCTGLAYESKPDKPVVLWTSPASIADRDLIYGQGGQARAPTAAPFVFVKEDRDGNSPKFVVKDRDGVEWKVKVGPEAQPEVAVTRFVWAVGYATDEDYFLASQEVQNLPAKLSRGAEYVSDDGIVSNARWERVVYPKEDTWKWGKNPFTGTQELNGLRVLMSLFNNYDMKDSQNTVYDDGTKLQFIVGDLGATLGPTGSRWPLNTPRGDPERFGKSRFVTKVTDDYVDFASPSWPMMFGVVPLLPLPYTYLSAPLVLFGRPLAPTSTEQRWIGKRVPRAHVAWIAGLLRQLTPDQMRAGFLAGGYTQQQAEQLGAILAARISELNGI